MISSRELKASNPTLRRLPKERACKASSSSSAISVSLLGGAIDADEGKALEWRRRESPKRTLDWKFPGSPVVMEISL